jgi:nucleotide-binding universal stress UspA family protein
VEASAPSQNIVVGVDGSEPSTRALRWAIDEAKLRGAALRVVTAWHVPLVLHGGSGATPPASLSLDDLVRQAAESVATAAENDAREAGVMTTERIVREGQPADVLIAVSEGATLLAVGSRSHSGFAALHLGSVSRQCAEHARCPTLLVR